MEKFIVKSWQLLMVLLLCAIGVKAETGTMERWGSKMKYTLSGGTVIKKSKPEIYGLRKDVMMVAIEGEVKEGATIYASCAKLAGPTTTPSHYWMKNVKAEIEIEYSYTDANGKMVDGTIKPKDNGNHSKSISIQIPKGAKKLHLDMTYNTFRTQFNVSTEWKVVSGTSTTTPSQPVQASGKVVSGKIQSDSPAKTASSYMTYNTSGGVLEKQDAEPNSSIHFVDFKVKAGTMINASFSGHNGGGFDTKKYPMTLVFSATGRDEKGNYVVKASDNLTGSTGLSKSYTIPKGVSTVKIIARFLGYECNITWDVYDDDDDGKTTKTTTTQTNIKWDDVAPDNFCPRCTKAASLYTFLTDVTAAGAGPGHIGCSQIATKKFDTCNPNKPIYAGDGIITDSRELVIGTEENINMLKIEPNSKVLFVGKVNGRDRWRVLKGRVIGENLVKVEEKQQIQMSNCMLDINGTIYVAEDNGKQSRVYLLDGSIDVKSNKTGKKYTMKPGQVVTVSNTGKMEAKKFDVAACAKKYNISTKNISTTPSTTPSTTTTTTKSSSDNSSSTKKKSSGSSSSTTIDKRYEVKAGVIKYKYVVNNKQGVMVRTFDNYGQLERQTLKMNGASSRTLSIQRGSTQYSVNEKEKTVTKKQANSKNFLTMTDGQQKKLNLTKKGTATVANKSCVVYANASEEYYIWQGVVLKKKSKTKSGTVVYEATSIELPASVDENNFQVSKDYKVK